MSAGDGKKQYGLIIPGKNKATAPPANVRKLNPLLGSDDELEKDEEEEECPLSWVEASLKKTAGNSGQKALQRRMLKEAIEEDASIFQYDEVYDEIQASKTAEVASKKEKADKKPKYIHNILKHAEKRKLESERRKERQVQKEREEEGEEFADKEAFVTASYLKKMEELKAAEAEAKLEEQREEQIDVMKHKNFGAFYNHIFKQRMGEPSIKKEPEEPAIKKEPLSESEDEDEKENETIKRRDDSKRHYRTQRDLSESPEREIRRQPSKVPRYDASSESEGEKKVESYRDRREKQNKAVEKRKDGRARERSHSRDRRRNRSGSRGRRGERTRSRERRREGSHSRERRREPDRGRGRDRSAEKRSDRDRDRKGRHRSRSRSPQRRRSRSPRRSRSREKVRVKEEPKTPEKKDKKSNKEMEGEKTEKTKESTDGKVQKPTVKKESEQEEKENRMDRIRKIFTKRTVGEKFEMALQRYYQRKAERGARG